MFHYLFLFMIFPIAQYFEFIYDIRNGPVQSNLALDWDKRQWLVCSLESCKSLSLLTFAQTMVCRLPIENHTLKMAVLHWELNVWTDTMTYYNLLNVYLNLAFELDCVCHIIYFKNNRHDRWWNRAGWMPISVT